MLFVDVDTDPTLAGVLLGDPTIANDTIRLLVKLGALVMDGAAFAEVMCSYTESALKACQLCVNFFLRRKVAS